MRKLLLALVTLTAPLAVVAQQPAQPAAPGDAASIVAFWSSVGDSTLARLVADALHRSPDVRSADARLRAARAERRASAFDLAPTVHALGGFTRSRPSIAQVPVGARRETELWDAGFDASWELDIFGHLQPLVAARSAIAGAAREDLRGTQVSLAAEVARTHYEVDGVQRQLAVAARNADNQRRTLQLTVDRLTAGRGTAFDRERANAQLSGTLAAIPTLESRLADATLRLAVLSGETPRATPPTAEEELVDSDTLPALPAVPSRDAVLALVAQRPDVRAAERSFAAQTSLVRAARADYLPRISVVGTVGFAAMPSDAFGRGSTSRYAVGPVLSWPAFDLGRVKARVDVARAENEEARAAYDQTLLVAQAEVEGTRVALDRARTRLAHLREAARASERGAELARLRFTGGAAGFLEVLDAERTMLDAQDRLAQGETDAATAFAALYKALGGAWPGM
jgi:NodT family efflux transporter outer membrane factor (OMF) lipoprotein